MKNIPSKKLTLARQTVQKLDVKKMTELHAGLQQEAGTTIYASIALATQTLSDAVCIWVCAQL